MPRLQGDLRLTRCAVYVRKSREDESRPAHRLELQRERLPAHARAQGWTVEVFDDGYASAARGKAELLPERGRLEAGIRAGQVDLVLVVELSRLSRDDTLQDYVRFLALAAEHQVRLATLSRVLDPCESSDWLLLLLEGGFSATEQRTILARLREGRSRAWEAGGHVGGAIAEPYRKGPGPGQLVVDDEAAGRVRAVLDEYVLRGTTAAAQLARGWGWHKNTVRRWVTDAGLDWLLARRPSVERPGEWVRCTWPAVLTPEQAEAVRQRRRRKAHGAHGAARLSLLAGLGILRCGYCGGRVTGQTSGARLYYGCSAGLWADRCRKSKLLRQEVLDAAVGAAVMGVLGRPGDLRAAWRAGAGLLEEREGRLVDAERELTARRNRLVEAIAQGVIDLSDARKAMEAIRAAEAAVQRDQADLAPAMTEPQWEGLAEAAEAWEELDREERRGVLGAVVDEINVYRAGGAIRFLFDLSEARHRSLPLRFRMVK